MQEHGHTCVRETSLISNFANAPWMAKTEKSVAEKSVVNIFDTMLYTSVAVGMEEGGEGAQATQGGVDVEQWLMRANVKWGENEKCHRPPLFCRLSPSANKPNSSLSFYSYFLYHHWATVTAESQLIVYSEQSCICQAKRKHKEILS